MNQSIKPKIIIIHVDDDDGDAKAVKRALSKANFVNETLRASDGHEALEMLRQRKFKTPNCILLVDINMPKMSGFEFIETMKKDESIGPMITFILSTSSAREDRQRAYELGVSGYITKSKAGNDFKRLVQLVEDYVQLVEMPQGGAHE